MTRRSYEGALVPVALYVASAILLFAASRALGVSLLEPPRLEAATAAAQLFSPAGKLVFSWSHRLEALSSTHPAALAPTILGGYLWAILARAPHAALDGLTALRLGSVLVAAAIPPLVQALTARWLGRSLSVLAAALTLLAPRALVDSATLAGDGVAVTLTLGALCAYLASVERRSAGYGVASASLVGLAAAASTSTLVVVPILIAHFMVERSDVTRRLLPRGGFPLPLAVAAVPVVGVAAFLLAEPYLLHRPVEQLRQVALTALSPASAPGTWGGVAPTLDALPRLHALTSVLLALPSSTSVLGVVGGIAIWKFPTGTARDGGSRARLLAITLGMVVLWPLLAPSAFSSFPSHWALAVPCAASFAAYGAGAVARAVPSTLGRSLVLAGAGAVALGSSLPSPSLSAFVPALTGGMSRSVHGFRAPLHDGSPVGGLARSIDALGLSAPTIYAPDVSAEAWTWMNRLGRLRTTVVPVPREDGATLLVLSGDVRGRGATVVAEVRRDGAPVLTLLRR